MLKNGETAHYESPKACDNSKVGLIPNQLFKSQKWTCIVIFGTIENIQFLDKRRPDMLFLIYEDT